MDVHHLLSDMALEMHGLESPADAVERIAHYARVAVGADDSGILLVKARGRVETPAATSEEVEQVHALQAELDEGPCLDAARGGEPLYVTGNAMADERWPTWGSAIAGHGYRSVASVGLRAGERTFGSLNAYSRQPDAFEADDLDVIGLLGIHASVAYAALDKAHNLQAAIDSRTVSGQAQGVLMAVYDLDAEAAFQYLRRISQDTNVRLLQVAREVVAERHELRKSIT